MSYSDFDVQHQASNIDSKIVAALERIAQVFRVLLWQESKEYALSPIQVQILVFLQHHSPEKNKVSYLAQEFGVSKATISDSIKALTQKNLIRKVSLPQDSRSYIIELSEEGRILAEKTSMFTQVLRHPIERMHSTDKENLLLSLFDIIRHLQQSDIISITRMCFTCNHYQYNGEPNTHYCHLLKQEIADTALRLDCPEHKQRT